MTVKFPHKSTSEIIVPLSESLRNTRGVRVLFPHDLSLQEWNEVIDRICEVIYGEQQQQASSSSSDQCGRPSSVEPAADSCHRPNVRSRQAVSSVECIRDNEAGVAGEHQERDGRQSDLLHPTGSTGSGDSSSSSGETVRNENREFRLGIKRGECGHDSGVAVTRVDPIGHGMFEVIDTTTEAVMFTGSLDDCRDWLDWKENQAR